MTAPIEQSVDTNGVDLVPGKVRAPFAALPIGDPSAGGIAFRMRMRMRMRMDTPNDLDSNIIFDNSVYIVMFGGGERFTSNRSTYETMIKIDYTPVFSNENLVHRTPSGARQRSVMNTGRHIRQLYT